MIIPMVFSIWLMGVIAFGYVTALASPHFKEKDNEEAPNPLLYVIMGILVLLWPVTLLPLYFKK